MSEEKKDITKTKSPETSSPKSEENAQTKEKKNVQRASGTRKQEQSTPKIDSTRQKSTKKTTTRKKKVPKVVFKKTHVAILASSIIVVCSLILTVAIFRYSDPRGAVQKEVTATQKTELTLQGDSSAPADSSGRQGSDVGDGIGTNKSGTGTATSNISSAGSTVSAGAGTTVADNFSPVPGNNTRGSESATNVGKVTQDNSTGTNKAGDSSGTSDIKTDTSVADVTQSLPDNALAMGGQDDKIPTVQGDQDSDKTREDFGIPQAVGNPKIALVFDDGGYSLSDLQHFLDLPFPLAVAVLPQLNNSVAAAQKIRAAGKELLLHQPMQAINLKVDPGPGAITPTMHTYEIAEVVRQNIAQIGPVVGMNNHEGSLITESAPKIGAVLEVCKNTGIFFLDSRTTANSVVSQVAMEFGMNILERDIFLDNTPNREDILKEFLKGVKVANRDGYAIMIGHIWSGSNLANLLEEVYPVLKSKGYTLVTPGDLYENLGY
ncbi:MAG: divergent polysaccharide deacetylase family protein [Candidatus Treponema excrementipullorum]|uniref:Divergent polysaccharide deacetylase family protein n=1 Tax=Candidatus Treponema excrementipullorum TaxID=2838768 RepID=A0A9E2L2V2_9SPIR|nr:divergent polysaccharide deacetylase family protein [Candidatus Treponema excrementipullorum]